MYVYYPKIMIIIQNYYLVQFRMNRRCIKAFNIRCTFYWTIIKQTHVKNCLNVSVTDNIITDGNLYRLDRLKTFLILLHSTITIQLFCHIFQPTFKINWWLICWGILSILFYSNTSQFLMLTLLFFILLSYSFCASHFCQILCSQLWKKRYMAYIYIVLLFL